MTSASPLDLIRPRTLDEALRALHEDGPLRPIAGCTDVLVGMHFGTEPARRFLDLWPLEELRGIREEGGGLRLGALTPWSDVRDSALVREHLPALSAAAREIGGVQIQNRGTVGGNLANGSPAGDSLPVFAVAEAVVIARSVREERRIPFDGFYTGYRATALRPDELIVAVEVPRVDGRQWFRKVGTRAAQAISKVVMAGVRGPEIRVAVGSVAATVVRLPRTEACLARGGSLQEAQRVLEGEIHPIDDMRSTAEYRRRVASNVLRQFWEETA